MRCTHTPNHLPLSLYRCFRRSRRSTRGAFLLPSTRSAYQLTVHLPNAQYKVNSNPVFPPPVTYLNDESQTDHYERMCVTAKSSRTLPQTSLPASNHWVASRERLKAINILYGDNNTKHINALCRQRAIPALYQLVHAVVKVLEVVNNAVQIGL